MTGAEGVVTAGSTVATGCKTWASASRTGVSTVDGKSDPLGISPGAPVDTDVS